MNEIEHYGIKGMKWGIRRTPEQLGHKNLKKAKTANFDKWGNSQDTNVLYISGYSGSGKSTLARSITDDNTDLIHLDMYYDAAPNIIEMDGDFRSEQFDSYLKLKDIKSPNEIEKGKDRESSKVISDFEKAIEDFGRQQYKMGRKVIVEGVQILDDSFQSDKSYFKSKPIALLGTNSLVAMQRAFKRDGRGNFINGLMKLDDIKDYIYWINSMNQNIENIGTMVNAKRGSNEVDDYLKKYGQRNLT